MKHVINSVVFKSSIIIIILEITILGGFIFYLQPLSGEEAPLNRENIIIISLAILITFSLIVITILHNMIALPLKKTANLLQAFEEGKTDMNLLLPDSSQDLGALQQSINSIIQQSTHQPTEQEKGSTETKRQQLQKERLSVLGEVTAVVVHDIRNPLGTISTSIYLINESIKNKDFEQIAQAAKLAERNITRCNNIISELLDFTQILELHKEKYNLDQWLMVMIKQYSFPEGLELTTNFNCSIEMDIDSVHLQRVIINVLNNAVQAMQDKNKDNHCCLIVETRNTNERIEISFKDTGSGIAPENQEKIFEPLFSTKVGRIGLGMSIVQSIMRQHGGDVEIESQQNRGTTVTLWLKKG